VLALSGLDNLSIVNACSNHRPILTSIIYYSWEGDQEERLQYRLHELCVLHIEHWRSLRSLFLERLIESEVSDVVRTRKVLARQENKKYLCCFLLRNEVLSERLVFVENLLAIRFRSNDCGMNQSEIFWNSRCGNSYSRTRGTRDQFAPMRDPLSQEWSNIWEGFSISTQRYPAI